MSALKDALADYLKVRRQLGFQLRYDSCALERFVGFLEQEGAERITTDLALQWARMPKNVHPYCWHQRLLVVRGFARHLATIDPDSEVPSTDLLPGNRPRIAPYIYTDTEIRSLIDAAGELEPPLRALRHQTLIGLLAVTGLRLGEALALDRADVDLDRAVLHVRMGKNGSQRDVPIHQSTATALGVYARARDAAWRAPQTPAFFISTTGLRMARNDLNRVFIRLIAHVGLEGRGARARPRPHDLRHTVAVRTLLDWYDAGEDIDRRMPLLSTYLGHVSPVHTYWYLEAVPELLARVSDRLGELEGVLS